MKNRSTAAATLCALVLLLVVSSGVSAQGNNKVMLVTWNVRGNTPHVRCSPRDLSGVKNNLLILKWNYAVFGIPLDVIGFQEIYAHQANDLARALGFPATNVYFVETKPMISPPCGYKFGNAIISRLPIVRTLGPESKRSYNLYLTPEDFHYYNEYNKLAGMSVVLPTGQRVRIYNAHYIGDNSVTDRRLDQAKYAWKQLAQTVNVINNSGLPYPSVVLGDFNIHPPNSPYDRPYNQLNYLGMIWLGFRDLWAEWAPYNGNPNDSTYPSLGRRIDYVVTRDPRIRFITGMVPNTGEASDHRPMTAYLSF